MRIRLLVNIGFGVQDKAEHTRRTGMGFDCLVMGKSEGKLVIKHYVKRIKRTIAKAKDAFSKFKKPIIIEDDGLFIDSIDGFPGPYSSYVFKTIGNKGILNLLKNNRKAKFVSIITYCDKTILQSFDGKLNGKISKTQKGKGWGYDPIFIPNNSKKTFAELNNKNELSHRYKALRKFSKWYLHK